MAFISTRPRQPSNSPKRRQVSDSCLNIDNLILIPLNCRIVSHSLNSMRITQLILIFQDFLNQIPKNKDSQP